MRQPTLYLPHGAGPCFFMDWEPPDTWARHRAFLENLPATLPERPRALLVISAHWEAPQFTVQKHPAPPLVFDYSGFPPHTYQLTWPAPGAPLLAEQVAGLLQAAGLACGFDERRGFDHGVFVPLKLAFPEADIPCVQLSLRADLDPAAHLAAGKALMPLRDEGVLILGSGNSYHNMQVMLRAWQSGALTTHGLDFDAWLTETVTQADAVERERCLIAWSSAPGAREAAPREEHLIPLLVVAGAGGNAPGAKIFEDRVLGAVQSAFRFG
ncbi:DODA-type extradiol aromatic ring-opening family dioxygenase [Thiobacter aerophilum]|uniref:Class III extradiol ring-cleavage dioxygenase n=1 Tax=Thiobacter aerophilum TaxID=3121275 RepID=A0ABV0EFM9_9BURK